MGAIRAAFASLVLLTATPAQADQVTRWRPYIAEASGRFGVPVEWIERVIRAESAGLTTLGGRPITSRAGAMGLMQLMPRTWAQMRVALRLGLDPYDPRDNILAGTAYLRLMYDRFGYPGLFGAYNAGPARYAAYLAAERTLPGETHAYLAAVGGGISREPGRAIVQPANGVFFQLGQRTETSEPASSNSDNGLFVTFAQKSSEWPTQ